MSNISVGGQAVIEGVMMQSKDKRAIAVRKSNGKIVLKKNNIKSWINETNDRFIKKIFKDKANDAIIGISLVLSLLFSVGIFILIPTTVGGIFSKIIDNKLILNLIEGIIRISILFAYIVIISQKRFPIPWS